MKSCLIKQGFCFLVGNMAIIQESTENFKKLAETTSYIFHTSLNRKITVFSLNFKEMDFRHAIGLHYLTDIDITRNAKKQSSGYKTMR